MVTLEFSTLEVRLLVIEVIDQFFNDREWKAACSWHRRRVVVWSKLAMVILIYSVGTQVAYSYSCPFCVMV